MIKSALRHWKNKPMQLSVIVMGYVISILVLSMMISNIQNKSLVADQNNFGKKGDRSALYVYSTSDKNYDYNTINIIKYLGKYGEINIIRLGNQVIGDKSKNTKVEISPCYYEKKPNWQPLIYRGRHLNSEECISNSKKVVIGIKIAEELGVTINDQISFYGTSYTIVGIMGKKNLQTNFDKAVYIPIGALPKEYLNVFKEKVVAKQGDKSALNLNILLRVKDQDIKPVLNKLKNTFKKNTFDYDIKKNYYQEVTFFDVIMDVVVTSIPLMLVALINVINISIFWIMNRKKEISIKKVLGATDKYIRKSIEADFLVVSILAAIIAMIIQYILYIKIEPIVNKYDYSFSLTWINFIISVAISVGIGYLASVIPVEKTMDMNPADVLRME